MKDGHLARESMFDRRARDQEGFTWSREDGVFLLRLWGSLPPTWVGNLALQASVFGIEIESGDAARIGAMRWTAMLRLRSSDPRARIPGCDFLRMARRAPRLLPPLPEPHVELLGSLEERVVVAHVTGKDALGLLAQTLRRFDALSLRPRELSLRTSGSERDDWFWLERV